MGVFVGSDKQWWWAHFLLFLALVCDAGAVGVFVLLGLCVS